MPIRHKSTFAKIVEKVESLNRRAEKRGHSFCMENLYFPRC